MSGVLGPGRAPVMKLLNLWANQPQPLVRPSKTWSLPSRTCAAAASASAPCTRPSTPPPPAAGSSSTSSPPGRVHPRAHRRRHPRGPGCNPRPVGDRLGRPPSLTAEQVRQARALLTRPENSVAAIARLLGVSRSTLYKHIPELGGWRRLAVEAPQPTRSDGGA